MATYVRKPEYFDAQLVIFPAQVLLGEKLDVYGTLLLIQIDDTGYYVSVSYCGAEKKCYAGDYIGKELLVDGNDSQWRLCPFTKAEFEAEYDFVSE